jgi:radical SAM superfamily enzyme YgiQ (UPF0313 family)
MADYELIAEVDRRLAEETGTLRSEVRPRVALCYPSPYHVGMSSLGYQTIYRELNGRGDLSAERAFLPDDADAYRKSRTPLFTYETKTAVGDCEIVAFSVAYELELAGVCSVLDLSGLPVLREERGPQHPLVVAGGPLTFSNPEPLEPFVDVLVQGEADELVHVLMDAALSMDREALLDFLARTPGFRVPGRGGVSFFVAKADTARLPAHSQILTPNTELRSMFLVEPERGCSRGCHYCVMRRTTNGGMRTLPFDKVLSLIPNAAKRVGLVGAAVTDHPKIVPLLREIVASGRQVGVSSLRADRLTQELVDALRAGGAQVLTVASDGASQRMRDLIDRKHSEEQIIRAANFARNAGIERLKVYSIVGLPLETDEDIDELIRFTTELSRILPIALGVSPFVAKRNTPLDGAPFTGIKEVEARLERLRRGLKGRAEVRPTSARWAWVEHMLAQCGPEAGLAVYDAWRAGATFADYKRAFRERGLTPFLARRVEDGRRTPTQWPAVAERRVDGVIARS